MGCTEPIAIAYARRSGEKKTLGNLPEQLDIKSKWKTIIKKV